MRQFLLPVLVFLSFTPNGHATLLGSLGDRCMQALGSTGACQLRGPNLEQASLRAEAMARSQLAKDLQVPLGDSRVTTVFVEARRMVRGPQPYLPIDVKFKISGLGTYTYRSRFNVCTKPIAFIGIDRLPKLSEQLGRYLIGQ